MTWIAPEVDRIDEPFTGPERALLDGWLESHRVVFLQRCAGLTGHADLLRERIDGTTFG